VSGDDESALARASEAGPTFAELEKHFKLSHGAVLHHSEGKKVMKITLRSREARQARSRPSHPEAEPGWSV
jgi:hypothetical protein